MRLAVLSDIHGNADALAAVLDDLKDRAPDAIVNLGDCFSGPLDVGRTFDLLMGADIAATVRGNHDRVFTDGGTKDHWDRLAEPKLTPAMRDWLTTLPATDTIDDMFLCHATPQDDVSYWLEEYTADGIARRAPLAAIEPRARGIVQKVMLCGHTHVARSVRLADGRQVVNPGSVGSPGFIDDAPRGNRRVSAGTPAAHYATLDRRGADWTVSLHQVPYDTAPAVALAQAAGCEDWVQALRTGWL